MVRLPLEKGSPISLGDHEHYKVLDLIGEGGFSLVYSVDSGENGVPLVIKEFFPAKGAFRNSQGVVCASPDHEKLFEERKKQFEREAYHSGQASELSFQIVPVLRSRNGYSVLQQRSADMKSLSDLEREWITRPPSSQQLLSDTVDSKFHDQAKIGYALKIIDSLLSALRSIHSQSRLHLDLSPQNVLWAGQDQDSGHNCEAFLCDFGNAVKWTDFDSFSSLLPSYSPGFAAPELTQKGSALTPATDLYSVGMLLFFLCCGRDAIRLISMVPFPMEILKRELGKLKISCLLRKHLQELISRAIGSQEARPQSAEEMQVAVRAVNKFISSPPALISNCLPIHVRTKHFVGRSDELSSLSQFFSCRTDDSSRIAIVESSISGLGKTELALRFAELHCGEYDAIEFCMFDASTGLNGVLNQCRLESGSSESELILSAFRDREKKKLLILDNYDTPDSSLAGLLQFQNTDVIITARYKVTEFPSAMTIRLFPNEDQAFELFKTIFEEDGLLLQANQENNVRRILHCIGSHTLLTDFIAQRARLIPTKLERLSFLVSTEDSRVWEAKVTSRKDVQESEADRKDTISVFMREIFKEFYSEDAFSYHEKRLLKLLLILLQGRIQKSWLCSTEFLCAALGDNFMDRCEAESALDFLVSRNFLQASMITPISAVTESKQKLRAVSMHPVVYMLLTELFHMQQTETIELAIPAICNAYCYNPNFIEYDGEQWIRQLFMVFDRHEECLQDNVIFHFSPDALKRFIQSDQGLAYAYIFLACCDMVLNGNLYDRVFDPAEESGVLPQICTAETWSAISNLEHGEKLVQFFLSKDMASCTDFYYCLYSSEKEKILACVEQGEDSQTANTIGIMFSSSYSTPHISIHVQGRAIPTKNMKLSILGASFSSYELNVPTCLNQIPVSEIADGAFSCNDSNEIIVPETITHIGRECFKSAFSEEIIIHAKIEFLEAGMFRCGDLHKVQLPSTLKVIGEACFENSSIRTLRLPDGLSRIENRAFAHCDYLEELRIPPSVTELAEDVFVGCRRLKHLIIPNTVNFGIDGSFPGICLPTYETIFPE